MYQRLKWRRRLPRRCYSRVHMVRREEQRHSCCQSSPDSEAFLRATEPARMKNDQRESDREWEGGRCRQAIFPQGIKSVGSHEDDAEREQKLVCPSLLQCTARLFPPAPAPSSYAGRAGRKYKAIRQWKRHEGKITAAAPSVNFRQPSQ